MLETHQNFRKLRRNYISKKLGIIKSNFSHFFGVFKHDKLELIAYWLLSESFKQKCKLNPVLEPDKEGKGGKNHQ